MLVLEIKPLPPRQTESPLARPPRRCWTRPSPWGRPWWPGSRRRWGWSTGRCYCKLSQGVYPSWGCWKSWEDLCFMIMAWMETLSMAMKQRLAIKIIITMMILLQLMLEVALPHSRVWRKARHEDVIFEDEHIHGHGLPYLQHCDNDWKNKAIFD